MPNTEHGPRRVETQQQGVSIEKTLSIFPSFYCDCQSCEGNNIYPLLSSVSRVVITIFTVAEILSPDFLVVEL